MDSIRASADSGTERTRPAAFAAGRTLPTAGSPFAAALDRLEAGANGPPPKIRQARTVGHDSPAPGGVTPDPAAMKTAREGGGRTVSVGTAPTGDEPATDEITGTAIGWPDARTPPARPDPAVPAQPPSTSSGASDTGDDAGERVKGLSVAAAGLTAASSGSEKGQVADPEARPRVVAAGGISPVFPIGEGGADVARRPGRTAAAAAPGDARDGLGAPLAPRHRDARAEGTGISAAAGTLDPSIAERPAASETGAGRARSGAPGSPGDDGARAAATIRQDGMAEGTGHTPGPALAGPTGEAGPSGGQRGDSRPSARAGSSPGIASVAIAGDASDATFGKMPGGAVANPAPADPPGAAAGMGGDRAPAAKTPVGAVPGTGNPLRPARMAMDPEAARPAVVGPAAAGGHRPAGDTAQPAFGTAPVPVAASVTVSPGPDPAARGATHGVPVALAAAAIAALREAEGQAPTETRQPSAAQLAPTSAAGAAMALPAAYPSTSGLQEITGAVSGATTPGPAGDEPRKAPGIGAGAETLAVVASTSAIARADPAAALTAQPPAAAPGSGLDVARQIGEQIRHAPAGDGTRVELTLAPQELGRIRMALGESQGTVTVFIQAERGETLDLLRRNIGLLAAEFTEAGLAGSSFSFGGFDHDPATADHASPPSDDDDTAPPGHPDKAAARSAAGGIANRGSSGLDLRI